MSKRVAFVTIGQAPRPDVTPDILAEVRTPLAVAEFGALDGLDRAAVAALAPKAGEDCLVSRLADGTEVLLAKPAIEARLEALLGRLDREDYDLIVLLCTGKFKPFRLKTPFIEPQHVVDHFTQGLAYNARRIGVMVPNERQIGEFHGIDGVETVVRSASPYDPDNAGSLDAAGRALADTDLIAMHCMGYAEPMRRRVAAAAHRPVLLSRQLVAHAIDLMVA